MLRQRKRENLPNNPKFDFFLSCRLRDNFVFLSQNVYNTYIFMSVDMKLISQIFLATQIHLHLLLSLVWLLLLFYSCRSRKYVYENPNANFNKNC